jgi:NADH-quinone oxidoreductase subunit J
METVMFILIFLVTVGSACIVALSPNLIYSAFALIGTFMGVAGTFVFLSADFVGLTQVMVYAGGILILTVFAVMLTSKIDSQSETNPVSNYKVVVPLILILIVLLGKIVLSDQWAMTTVITHESTIAEIGNKLLTDYLLPFELISVLLLMAMIGAAIITRRHVKE